MPDIARLMKEDPNLHVVLKDFPVLGPGSVEAARVASAVRNQLQGERFWEFHNKLLGLHGPVGKQGGARRRQGDGARHGPARKGHDAPRTSTTACSETWRWPTISRSTARPTFVVGDAVVVGAVGYDELKTKIDAVHKCGQATC